MGPLRRARATWVGAALWLTGCAPEIPGRTVEVWTDRSNADGIVGVDVRFTRERNQALILVDAPPFTSLETILDPDGALVLSWEDWAPPNPRSLTWSVFAMGSDSPLNWPVREQDGPLQPGQWTFAYSTLDAEYRYLGRQDVEITVITKVDPDLTTGTLPVTLFVADDPTAPDLTGVIDTAVLRFQEIWAQAGITVDVEIESIEVDPGIPDPSDGDAMYVDLAERASGRVVVVLAEQILNENGRNSGLFGKVGSIPNALTPTKRGALAVSWLAHAGANGAFGADEARLLGETLAHEVGHYAGLFHPVESRYDAWDALDDTPECSRGTLCDDALGAQLMYPYPLCDGLPDQNCDPQGELTPQQIAVLNRYVGVD